MTAMHLMALVLGLSALARADVSHLKPSAIPTNSLSNDDKLNSAGNARYWWLNTESSPFTKSHNNQNYEPQIDVRGGEHQTQNILHDTQQPNYRQNPFLNANTRQQPEQHDSHNYKHMATLSGSPSEVNNLMLDTPQTRNIADSYRPVPRIPCYGASQVCAPNDACENGFIREKNLGLVLSQSNNCDSQLESCCNILSDVAPQNADSPQCSEPNTACVLPRFCYNGVIDQSAEHQAVRSATGTCDSPSICCKLSGRKRQAPYPESSFAASTSEVLTKEGYVVNVPSNQYLPSFPEPQYKPSSSNEDLSRLKPEYPSRPAQPSQPSIPAPQQPAPQQPQRPSPQQPQRPTPQQPAPEQPQRPYPSQPAPQQPQRPTPQQPAPQQPQRPTPQQPAPQQPQRPTPQQPAPQQPQRPYEEPYPSQPSQPSQPRPSQATPGYIPPAPQPNQPEYQPQPSQLTPGYQPQPSQPSPGYQPQPSQPSPGYEPLPSQPNQPYQPQPSQSQPARINPPSAPRQPQYQPQANQPRPSVVTQDQATIIHAGCPAAMNCTLIEYCSATAVISKTPVQLTEFEQEYRVPMTDCLIKASGEAGKCCRDSDYTDPWPIGRFGQYNADELNAVFDSGAYKP